MMATIADFSSNIKYLVIGNLTRDFIITPGGKPYLDVPGGSLLYAAGGLRVWDHPIGLVSRIGEDYPGEWLDVLGKYQLDRTGIAIQTEIMDTRNFTAYLDMDHPTHENLITQFNKVQLNYPKQLLGYTSPLPKPDSRTQLTPLTIRTRDIPPQYLDASAAHLCPLDFQSHSFLPGYLRQGNVTTTTLDPGNGYMSPVFWDDIPTLVKGITAFICSQEKISNLFQGRTNNLWEMAEAIASYNVEFIVINRGSLGQYLYDAAGKCRWSIPPYPSRWEDPTGAEDAYCGGFLAGYKLTYEPLEAALYGAISYSLCVEGSGPFYPAGTLPGLAQARLEFLKSSVRQI